MKLRHIYSAVVIVGVASFAFIDFSLDARAEPENCQYPGRPTNTATTCDNLEPADPEEISSWKGSAETELDPDRPSYGATEINVGNPSVETGVGESWGK